MFGPRAALVTLGLFCIPACGGNSPIGPDTAAGLASLSLQSNTVTGSESVEATVVLTGPARAGGVVVHLSSSNAAAIVPVSITVPQNMSTTTFTITTQPVTTDVNAAITASTETHTLGAVLAVKPLPPPGVSGLEIDPSFEGGQSTVGTVRIAVPAPAGGVIVTLASDNAAVIVPATVTIPGGAQSATFQVTSREVTSEARVIVSATSGGQTRTAEIRLRIVSLPPLPTFFRFTSAPGDYIGGGRSRNFTASDGSFAARTSCNNRIISLRFDGGTAITWFIEMAAPIGTALTRGSYTNATRWPFQVPNMPGLSISGEARGCNRLFGSFVVSDAAFGEGGLVRRFRATFEQHCESLTAPALVGEISVSDPRLGGLTGNCF